MTNQITGWMHLNYTSSSRLLHYHKAKKDRTLNRGSLVGREEMVTEVRAAVLVFSQEGVNFFDLPGENQSGFLKGSTGLTRSQREF